MFHPGGSDGVITDDSPQVVDVAASSNQGQARLANKTSYNATAALESQAPVTGSFMKSHLQRLRPGGAVERWIPWVSILKILAPHFSNQVEESPHKKAKQSAGSGPSCFALWHIDLPT